MPPRQASWRLLPFAVRGAAENMALDEALLRLAEVPTLRFYGWRPGALSIGYAQDVPAGWREPVVRRQTGGGAIWHDREVTYCLAGHEDALGARDDIRGLYQRAHAGIVKALAEFGLEARIQAEGAARGKDDPFACFEKPASGDVLAQPSGRKIAGSAQRRLRRRLLLHGSVMLAHDRRNGTGGTGLLELLGRDVEPEYLADALVRGFSDSFSVPLEPGALTPEEEGLAERLVLKYESDAWTHRKDVAGEDPDA